jgi:signal peptidase I
MAGSARPSTVRNAFTNLVLPLLLATAMFFTLRIITNSTYPILVIKSESMSPAFNRGDVVFLSNRTNELHVGDVPALWFRDQAQPMIHRVIRTFAADARLSDCSVSGVEESCRLFVTKGDFNAVDDIALYPAGRVGANRAEVMGLAVGYLPWLGWPSLWVNEIWWARYAIAGIAVVALLRS